SMATLAVMRLLISRFSCFRYYRRSHVRTAWTRECQTRRWMSGWVMTPMPISANSHGLGLTHGSPPTAPAPASACITAHRRRRNQATLASRSAQVTWTVAPSVVATLASPGCTSCPQIAQHISGLFPGGQHCIQVDLQAVILQPRSVGQGLAHALWLGH